jgi:pimeloyl-ACP methyl ester carboxylesterase
MATASVNGQKIAYDDTGGEGPPVVLAHGFLMGRSMFESQVAALRDRYRVIIWDERGIGETVDDGDSFTYWELAADGLALLDHLGIDSAVVGGMSQGGFISLRMALAAPARVRALILLDTQAGLEDPEAVPLYRGMMEDWVANGVSDEIATVAADLIIGDPVLSEPWIQRWKDFPPERLLRPGETLLNRDDVTDRLGEITVPALVVHGTADASIPMARAEALAAGLTGSTGVVPIEGGTHAANMTHPDAVNAAIREFLDGLPA